jgi:putative membrane protein
MTSRYRPAKLMLWLGEWIQRQVREGHIDAWAVLAFDRNLNALSEVIGGCERIASTPLPFAYSVMIHRTVYFYCAALPFGLVGSTGIYTGIFTVFVAYTFMALEAIAAQIEDPFGTEDNDLALNTMSATIEDAMRDLVGDCAIETHHPIAGQPFVFD